MSAVVSFELDAVFVHTDIMKTAIRMYSSMLDYPVVSGLYDGPIYAMELANGVKLIIDDHRLDTHHYESKPTFVLRCSDIQAAFHAVKQQKWEIVQSIATGVGMSFFIFKDREGLLFAICDRMVPYPTSRAQVDPAGRSVVYKISEIYLPVRHPTEAYNGYAQLMGYNRQPSGQESNSLRIPLACGAELVFVPRALRPQWPLARIETADLSSVQAWLRTTSDVRRTVNEDSSVETCDRDGNLLAWAETDIR